MVGTEKSDLYAHTGLAATYTLCGFRRYAYSIAEADSPTYIDFRSWVSQLSYMVPITSPLTTNLREFHAAFEDWKEQHHSSDNFVSDAELVPAALTEQLENLRVRLIELNMHALLDFLDPSQAQKLLCELDGIESRPDEDGAIESTDPVDILDRMYDYFESRFVELCGIDQVGPVSNSPSNLKHYGLVLSTAQAVFRSGLVAHGISPGSVSKFNESLLTLISASFQENESNAPKQTLKLLGGGELNYGIGGGQIAIYSNADEALEYISLNLEGLRTRASALVSSTHMREGFTFVPISKSHNLCVDAGQHEGAGGFRFSIFSGDPPKQRDITAVHRIQVMFQGPDQLLVVENHGCQLQHIRNLVGFLRCVPKYYEAIHDSKIDAPMDFQIAQHLRELAGIKPDCSPEDCGVAIAKFLEAQSSERKDYFSSMSSDIASRIRRHFVKEATILPEEFLMFAIVAWAKKLGVKEILGLSSMDNNAYQHSIDPMPGAIRNTNGPENKSLYDSFFSRCGFQSPAASDSRFWHLSLERLPGTDAPSDHAPELPDRGTLVQYALELFGGAKGSGNSFSRTIKTTPALWVDALERMISGLSG